VPLSDHEQRMLEQMERALSAEDPKLASTFRGSGFASGVRRRFGLAAIGFLIGVGLLLVGVVFKIEPVSVLGFIQMLLSVTYVVAWRDKPKTPDTVEGAIGPNPTKSKKKSKRNNASFMDGMEERWRRRSDDNGM
jgi:hypothetical protein